MNIVILIDKLEKEFESFTVHSELIAEITDIIGRSGNEKSFLSKLSNALKFLKRYGTLAHLQPTNQFEKLSGTTDLYSMHIQGKTFNVRILYSFANDGTILLHGFHEEENKRATDYTSAIPIAYERIKEMEE